jgi:hypothetical protein
MTYLDSGATCRLGIAMTGAGRRIERRGYAGTSRDEPEPYEPSRFTRAVVADVSWLPWPCDGGERASRPGRAMDASGADALAGRSGPMRQLSSPLPRRRPPLITARPGRTNVRRSDTSARPGRPGRRKHTSAAAWTNATRSHRQASYRAARRTKPPPTR